MSPKNLGTARCLLLDYKGHKWTPFSIQGAHLKIGASWIPIWEFWIHHWICNRFYRSRPQGQRKGYMGHLTHIANHVVEQMDKGTNADRIKEAFQGETSIPV